MLDAAVAAFARHGYQAASMDEIAEAAGVSKPLVYLYLKSKEELFMACVRREIGALVAAVREGTRERGLPADQQLWHGLRAFFAHTAARPAGVRVLYRARTQGEPFAGEVARMRAELLTLVTGLLGQAARDAGCGSEPAEREVSGLAHALVGAAESLAEWAAPSTGGGPGGNGARGEQGTRGGAFAPEGASDPHSASGPHGTSDPHGVSDPHSASGPHGTSDPHGVSDSHGVPAAHSAKEAAATLMNFCWVGLESLMRGARWSPGAGAGPRVLSPGQ